MRRSQHGSRACTKILMDPNGGQGEDEMRAESAGPRPLQSHKPYSGSFFLISNGKP